MSRAPSNKFAQTIFVVSTGRTGTQAIATYFDQTFPDVTALHEPAPSRRFRVLSNLYLCNKISGTTVESALLSARQKLMAQIDSDIYLEANPFLHGCLPALAQAFPGCHLVHIVRDPRTYIPSHINHGVFHGLKGFAGAYFPYWLLKPSHYESHPLKQWNEMSLQERLGWRWNTINGVLDEGRKIFGERYLRLRFEDLFDAEKSGLKVMADWMGLSKGKALMEAASRKRHNASQGPSFPLFEEWEPTIQKHVLQLCTTRMAEYGYDSSTTGR